MKDIKYKLLFAFSIPYLTICAGLWHIGYWSTFDINILNHLNTSDLIKSFIYPFISSTIFFFGGQIISTMFFKNSLLWQKEFKYGGAEDNMHPKQLKVFRYIILGLSISFIVLSYIYAGNYKWIGILFIIATYIGVFLNNKNFLDHIIPDRNLRLNFVFTIILIPCLSFGFAKMKSNDILDNKNSNATIVSIITSSDQVNSSLNEKYKLLGITSDFVFLMSSDNKSIIMLTKKEVEQIKIEINARYYPRSVQPGN